MSGGTEALKEAIRRSLPLVVVLVVLGIAAMNTLRQLSGPVYAASAQVLNAPNDLAATLADIQTSFVDPDRAEEVERAVAASDELFERTARSNEDLGTADELQDATTVDARSGIITFTVETDDPELAVDIANALSEEYISYREDIQGATIREAIIQIRAELADAPADATTSPFLREQLNRLELLQTLNSGNAVPIDEADEAEKISPAPIRDSLLGGAIGFLLAVLLAGTREALNTRVRSEVDVEELLDVPVLASVRTLPRRARLVMYGRHEEEFGDTYALLAASLMQLRESGGERLLAVTSAGATEGKTTTAANLAVALARRGANVILADFDVRRPSLGTVFGIDEKAPGVLQAITHGTPVERMLWSVPVIEAGRTRLWNPYPLATNGGAAQGESARPPLADGSLLVLPAGGSLSAAELVRSKRLPELLESIRSSADFVILDTPPALLTAEMTELSRSVDMVVAVVRQGRASRRNLEALRRQANSWTSRFVGAVLTDVSLDERGAYYGNRYGGK